MSVARAHWRPVTGGRWLTSFGLSDPSERAASSLASSSPQYAATAGRLGQSQPRVGASRGLQNHRGFAELEIGPEGARTQRF